VVDWWVGGRARPAAVAQLALREFETTRAGKKNRICCLLNGVSSETREFGPLLVWQLVSIFPRAENERPYLFYSGPVKSWDFFYYSTPQIQLCSQLCKPNWQFYKLCSGKKKVKLVSSSIFFIFSRDTSKT
jgi:hypothetical protein